MEYTRYYRIICLKRSTGRKEDGHSPWLVPVYWRRKQSGYTDDPSMAGIYRAQDVEDCAGCKGDWLLEPLSDVELREANGLPPLTGLEPFEMPRRY